MAVVLGIKVFGITNATGGTLDGMYPSCIMVIGDHFRFLSRIDPLRELLSESILDVSKINLESCWNQEYYQLCKKLAKENEIQVFEGTYTWTSGPSFETPAETLMSKELGGGCLGMSTVPEVLVAKACGMEVFGISCCTNLGAGLTKNPPTHEEVMEMAEKGAPKFRKLLKLLLENVPIPKEEKKLQFIKVKDLYQEKPFPFTSLASSTKIAAGTVIKKLQEVARIGIIIDKAHIKYLDHLKDKNEIKFTDIPDFPFKSFGSEKSSIICGTTKNGERVFVIVCEKIVGLITEEASFLSMILYELGVKFVIMAIVGSRANNKIEIKENIVGLKDFSNFTYATRQFKVLYRFCEPSEQALKEPFISPKIQNYYSVPTYKLMSFYSCAFPSKAEREFSRLYGSDMVSITSLTALYTLRFLGIQVVPLVTLPKNDQATMDVNHVLKGIDDQVIQELEKEINSIIEKSSKDVSEMKLEQFALPEKLPDKRKYNKPFTVQSIYETFNFLKEKFGEIKPTAAYVDFDLDLNLSNLKIEKSILLEDIPNLKFHGKKNEPKLILGTINGKSVLCVLGTAFSYEYSSCVDLSLIFRTFYLFGIKKVYMTSSFISVDPNFKSNDICIIKDHINFTGRNPLIGHNLEQWGTRFPDMSSVYDSKLRSETIKYAKELNIEMKESQIFFTPSRMLYSPMDRDAAYKYHCNLVSSLGVNEVIISGHSKIEVAFIGIVQGDKLNVDPLKNLMEKVLSQ